MNPGVDITPGNIRWAIARAGYKFQDFAEKFPRVLDWLEDKKKPTLKQLEEFSHRVHVPLGYLFLPEPPQETLPIPFFRTVGKVTDRKSVGVNVYDTILLIQQRQDWLSEYLKENDFSPLSYVGKFRSLLDADAIVADIRDVLELGPDWASAFRKQEEALEGLLHKAEQAGIVPVVNSVVENNTSRHIPVEECRGFVLVDNYAPFIFINNSDGKAAQLFTVVHELAHLWIGQSAGFDLTRMLPAHDSLELLCDKVAAEFLVPASLFNEAWQQDSQIDSLARHFKVSRIVIARRALDLGKISRATFFNFYAEYSREIQHKKEIQSGGGDFYATTKKRLSLAFAAHIDQAVKTGRLLYRDAYRLTSLKGDTYKKFFDQYF